MKIFKNLFSRHPPEALSNAELRNPEKRAKFRTDFIRYFNTGKPATGRTFWIKHQKNWLLICHWATPEMTKKYRYIRKEAPVHEDAINPKEIKEAVEHSASETDFIICYVTRTRYATCPRCNGKYRNVSGPFPRKARCKVCGQPLILKLDEKT